VIICAPSFLPKVVVKAGVRNFPPLKTNFSQLNSRGQFLILISPRFVFVILLYFSKPPGPPGLFLATSADIEYMIKPRETECCLLVLIFLLTSYVFPKSVSSCSPWFPSAVPSKTFATCLPRAVFFAHSPRLIRGRNTVGVEDNLCLGSVRLYNNVLGFSPSWYVFLPVSDSQSDLPPQRKECAVGLSPYCNSFLCRTKNIQNPQLQVFHLGVF